MNQFRVTKLRLFLALLLALELTYGLICPQAKLSLFHSPLSLQSRARLFSNTTIISDFDGDNRPDIATTRSEAHGYKVEIQLSSRPEKVSFSLASSELGIGLFACDVNRDNDSDIVIVSANSQRPLAVWLSDGHGNFDRDYSWSSPDFLDSDNLPGYEQKESRAETASISQNGRLSFDRSFSGFVAAKLERKNPISGELQESSLQVLVYKFISRSPPRLHHLIEI